MSLIPTLLYVVACAMLMLCSAIVWRTRRDLRRCLSELEALRSEAPNESQRDALDELIRSARQQVAQVHSLQRALKGC